MSLPCVKLVSDIRLQSDWSVCQSGIGKGEALFKSKKAEGDFEIELTDSTFVANEAGFSGLELFGKSKGSSNILAVITDVNAYSNGGDDSEPNLTLVS